MQSPELTYLITAWNLLRDQWHQPRDKTAQQPDGRSARDAGMTTLETAVLTAGLVLVAGLVMVAIRAAVNKQIPLINR